MGDEADRIMDAWNDDQMDDEGDHEIAIAHHGVINESPKAWEILLDRADPFSPVKEWFPKSRCRLDGDAVIWVPAWLVDEKDVWEYQDQE